MGVMKKRLHKIQVMKHESEGIHPGFETYCGRHQKSKTGVLLVVAPRRTNVLQF